MRLGKLWGLLMNAVKQFTNTGLMPNSNFSSCSHPLENTPFDENRDYKEAALNLCVAVIVADKKILQVEIDTYVSVLSACFKGDTFDVFDADYDFYEHANYVQKIINSPSKKFWLGIQHMRLRNYSKRRLLLDKLWRLSVSDGKLDSREADIVDFFTHLWRDS